jgi:hypothetical protein
MRSAFKIVPPASTGSPASDTPFARNQSESSAAVASASAWLGFMTISGFDRLAFHLLPIIDEIP